MTTTDSGTARPGRGRQVVGLVLVVIALVVAACNGGGGAGAGGGGGGGGRGGDPHRPGEPADPRSQVARPAATFEATVTPGEDSVEVRYTLHNDGGAELLVVNGVPRPSGASLKYDSDLAYVTGDGDRAVVLSQRAFPWPEPSRKSWESAPQVGVTRLRGHESLTVTLSVPRPLERRQPFGQDVGFGPIALPEDPGEVSFCLGVIASPYPAAVRPRASSGGEETIGHGNAAHEAQYLFCSDPVPLG